MKLDSENMQALLAAARQGSGEALGRLLEACRGYLLLVARNEMGADVQAKGGASDLVQETFLEAQLGFARFEGTSEEELLAWMRRLLLNNLSNFTRRYRGTTKRSVGREVALDPTGAADGLARHLSVDTPTPGHRAAANEEAELVWSAIKRLPDDHRQLIEWRYREGLSFGEIAERMGRTPNAIRKLWGRVLDRLQEEMGST